MIAEFIYRGMECYIYFQRRNSCKPLILVMGVNRCNQRKSARQQERKQAIASEAKSIFGTASFMYRRQPKDGEFSWRIGFTPIISNGYIQPSGGVSVGYNF